MDEYLVKTPHHKQILKINAFSIFFFMAIVSATAQTSVNTGHPSITYTAYRNPVVLAPSLTLNAPVGSITDVKVSIETILTGDLLSVNLSSYPGFSSSWNNTTKTLTITGSGSVADYQSILRTVTFYTNNTTTPRRVNFIMANVVSLEIDSKEHVYELVNNGSSITWTSAKTAAEARTITTSSGGTEYGYLATITSAEENSFIAAKVSSNTWLGASDDFAYTGDSEGEWYWVTGPEAGQKFWTGGQYGSSYNGMYEAWYTGEPNNAVGGEDFMHMYGTGGQAGSWNDFANTNGSVYYYLVEYGGKTTSPSEIVASDYVDITIKANTPPVADNESYSRFYTDTGVWLNVSAANGVLNGDSDADGDPITATIYQNPAHGAVSLNSNGSFSYRPNNGYIGSDVFYYRAYDGLAYSNVASVTITIQTPRFTGAGADDNFNNTVNWNCGYVPPESLNIIIGANQHMDLNQNYTCKNLQFESEASFDCESPYKLTITGNILNRNGETAIGISTSMVVSSSISINNE